MYQVNRITSKKISFRDSNLISTSWSLVEVLYRRKKRVRSRFIKSRSFPIINFRRGVDIQEQSPIEKLLSGKTLGQKIMYLRKLRGFTKRQDFVNAVNEGSYGYIWEIEAGIVTNVPEHILKRIADVLQIPIDFLQE